MEMGEGWWMRGGKSPYLCCVQLDRPPCLPRSITSVSITDADLHTSRTTHQQQTSTVYLCCVKFHHLPGLPRSVTTRDVTQRLGHVSSRLTRQDGPDAVLSHLMMQEKERENACVSTAFQHDLRVCLFLSSGSRHPQPLLYCQAQVDGQRYISKHGHAPCNKTTRQQQQSVWCDGKRVHAVSSAVCQQQAAMHQSDCAVVAVAVPPCPEVAGSCHQAGGTVLVFETQARIHKPRVMTSTTPAQGAIATTTPSTPPAPSHPHHLLCMLLLLCYITHRPAVLQKLPCSSSQRLW